MTSGPLPLERKQRRIALLLTASFTAVVALCLTVRTFTVIPVQAVIERGFAGWVVVVATIGAGSLLGAFLAWGLCQAYLERLRAS